MIGVFDSGLGGLTVLPALMDFFPQEDIIYLADNAHAPYGDKIKQDIARYAQWCAQLLADCSISALVIACGTATWAGMEAIESILNIPVIGIISPIVWQALHLTRNNRIGVLATQASVQSHVYAQSFYAHRNEKSTSLTIVEVAAPRLVPLIDQGNFTGDEIFSAATQYCQSLIQEQVDTVILGCTHYPHISPLLRSILGSDIELVDSGEAIAAYGNKLFDRVISRNIADKTIHSKYLFHKKSTCAPHYYFSSTAYWADFQELCLQYCSRYDQFSRGEIIFLDYEKDFQHFSLRVP